MITIQEWNQLSNKEKSTHLEFNFKATKFSLSRRKVIEGFGVNDAPYMTQVKICGIGVKCPAYVAWKSVIQRSLSVKFQLKNNSYKGVSVDKKWERFSDFRAWWMLNNVDGWQIDKDILGGGCVYGPSYCMYVPSWLNNFILDGRTYRGDFPIGVSLDRRTGNFVASCSSSISGCGHHIGMFKRQESAHLAWRTRKLELALELKPRMDEIDLRIYPRIVEIINNAK